MYKLVLLAALVAVASAAPGYLGGLGDYGLGHGVAIGPAVSVAHAPIALAHAPIAVAHAPVATSYANSNLISQTIGVRTVAAHAPVIVKSVHAPVAVAAPISYGHGLGLGHGYGLGLGAHY